MNPVIRMMFMGFQINNKIRYFTFASFCSFKLPHGIFMRHGGVSPSPWESLNLGGDSGDTRENIIENRKRIFNVIDRPVNSLFDVWQVHSDKVICVDRPRKLDEKHIQADSILTDNPKITLFMRFADCVPIYLFDPFKRVIGIVHAGWIGTLKKISQKTIQTMKDEYGCRPENIYAGIGPSISVNHYQIREDVIQKVKNSIEINGKRYLVETDGRVHLDLWKANRDQLLESGLRNVELAGVCTASHVGDWFSHRAENGRTGRFGALLAL